MRARFFDIVWDTDGQTVDLPKEVVREVSPETNLEEEAADLLSDEFGWCVTSCNFETIE